MALGAWPLIPCAENLESNRGRYAIQWLRFGIQDYVVAWTRGETSSTALAGCCHRLDWPRWLCDVLIWVSGEGWQSVDKENLSYSKIVNIHSVYGVENQAMAFWASLFIHYLFVWGILYTFI
jgi:hypothetical protein